MPSPSSPQIDLVDHTARLSVGELADFTVGPRDGGDGPTGIWRAQLGSRWHREMQTRTTAEQADARFEVPVEGAVIHRDWQIHLTGRIDQWLPQPDLTVLREIKTLTCPLPRPEKELRDDYPSYFAQLAIYLALHRIMAPATRIRGELVLVEVGTGLSQTIRLAREDEDLFPARLERFTAFLDLHQQAHARRQSLVFSPAFPTRRPGQEDTRARLEEALAESKIVTFEAPTGFGKTGVMLEVALHALKSGPCDRVIYVTSKSTGQLQVMSTLDRMTARPDHAPGHPLAVWHVRNKREHCVNHTFNCVRKDCHFMQDLESRWPASGLDRFHLFDGQRRDLATLRQAGQHAGICPYEITRTALAFQDVWVGDYNYVFAPRNQGLFAHQPGCNFARTLLLVDEAHNLPSRVADAHSHQLSGTQCQTVWAELDHQGASPQLRRSWESLTLLVAGMRSHDALSATEEDDLIEALGQVTDQLSLPSVGHLEFSAELMDLLWRPVVLDEWLRDTTLTRLLWSPDDGEIAFTCLDAAPAISEVLRSFGQVVLASATAGPPETVQASLGLPADAMGRVNARTPWRDGAYEVAVDLRVDTRYRQRSQYYGETAATVAQLAAAADGAVVVFFPSYRYAEAIERKMMGADPGLRVELQPRLPDLGAQAAWVEQSLVLSGVLFLVLGSSFAESIDLLGGKVSHAMVVGPALPEVNARQRAWFTELQHTATSRDEAFDRVYRVPGLQKVNQGLGRLVRAPGHRTKVLLHCRRFVDPAYARLLAPDYQLGVHIADDPALTTWLGLAPESPA